MTKKIAALLFMALLPIVAACGGDSAQGRTADVAQAEAGGLISPTSYQSEFDGVQHLLLDVRTPQEFAEGHISGAVNIAVQDLSRRLNELPQDQPIVLYCRSGNRSQDAMRILHRAGYTAVYDMGGIIDWVAQGFPTQR
ncbi:MAG: rhodanese-like domain-containing protein [Anaerolineaceae bacterium]|nr:MAG: rhodanese-like domain-containing protein [Anaerolineaceae bacterium]